MNWTKIKKHYPKAWEECMKSEYGYTLKSSSDRDLYSFFDSENIFIETTHSALGFGMGITYQDRTYVKAGFKTRIEAEDWAFEKCFEILEKIL